MTSIILTQRTMKLGKTDLDQLRRQQIAVNREKYKMVKVLKSILVQDVTNKTCRLCLRKGGRKIFNGGQDFDVALNIKYVLGIEIREDDGKPQHVCESCEVTVHRASRLKQTAETSQWRLQQERDMVIESSKWSADGKQQVTREWRCKKCRNTFCSQELTAHRKRPSCGDGFVCESCGVTLKTWSQLKRHSMIHTGPLPHSCAQCPYRGRTVHALRRHRGRHAPPPPYVCARCGRVCSSRQSLQNHMESQHSSLKSYVCNSCGKAFATRKMMLRHELKMHKRPRIRPAKRSRLPQD